MMRSLQHSPETLPADPCRIILRPPSVKFIKKEKRKTKKTMDRRCRYSIRTPRSILDPFMPRIEREIGSVNVEDAFDSSSNRSFPIIVGRPFKKGEKKSQTRTLARPSHPFPPLLDTCWQIVSSLLSIHRGMHHRDDADEGHAHALCNPSEQCKQSMHRSRFIRIQTVPFWFLNYRSPMIDRSQRFSSDAGT